MQPQQFSLYGAVDLGARQSAAQRRQQQAERASAQAPPGDGAAVGASVSEVTEETFTTEVVERSRSVPVIVDLWAEWCQPCKQLSPVLEKLAAEAGGRWVLAKVDVDANPQLSAALRVQSIPMVIAVIAGQMVDGFLGALPEAQVREWLTQVLAAAEQLGVGPAQDGGDGAEQAGLADHQPAGSQPGGQPGGQPGAPGPSATGGGPASPRSEYEAAQEAMARGDFDTAAVVFEQVLAATPDDPVAKAGLAQVDLIRRVNSYDQAQARRAAAEHPGDVDAQARVADLDLAAGKIDEAFDRLLGTIRRTSGDERDRARRHLVSLFEIFPPRDPRVVRARSTLSSLLF
ncbi:MAG TPA: tetratricopeptide repeat protein [Streptosporangiaceae bacterium]|nr:tetratricopeptide repeat protein [Streptosporangiaceae bacterium]